MLGLGKLTNAITALAANLTALAGTVAEVNANVRGRLALDAPEEPPALTHDAGPTVATILVRTLPSGSECAIGMKASPHRPDSLAVT